MFKSKELPEELVVLLEKAGVKKDAIDEYMIWGVYKLALGVMKVKWSLDENGVKGKEADEKLDSILKAVAKKDAEEIHKIVHKADPDDWKK